MAWNEPGDKDPWGGRRNGGGPPDLDEVVRKMQDKLGGLFGGGGPSRGGGGAGSPLVWSVGAIVLLVALVVECAYIIQPAERGVVLRFGQYVATLEPGLSFRWPRPVEAVEKVDVDQIRDISHNATMLTKDENIVDIELAVQYKIKDVVAYWIRVKEPDGALRQATETAVRGVIGTSDMDFVLTEGRSEIARRTKEQIQAILDNYDTGLIIDSVNMRPAKPPEEVKAAFDDAIKAREDEQRLINEAEAYHNEVLPNARGAAARQVQEANGYRERVIASATGETERFKKLLTEYQKAPAVTRQRLYLETVESVLSNSSKVLLDVEGSNNILYLPLDDIVKRSHGQNRNDGAGGQSRSPVPLSAERDRENSRARGNR